MAYRSVNMPLLSMHSVHTLRSIAGDGRFFVAQAVLILLSDVVTADIYIYVCVCVCNKRRYAAYRW